MRIVSSVVHTGPLLALALASLACLGCQTEAPAPPEPEAEADPGEAAPPLVAGWSCDGIEACLGLEVGSRSTYERRVGTRVENEVHTLADRVPGGDVDPGAYTFVDLEGEPRFRVRAESLALEIRGELMEAVRFPVAAGDHFEVDDGAGNPVSMTVLETDATWESPAGTFSPCIVHEARLENPEQPDRRGLRVATTMCQGVGQVARTIEHPSLPLPVEFSLLVHEGLDESGDRG